MRTPHMLLDLWGGCCPGIFGNEGNVLFEMGIVKVEKVFNLLCKDIFQMVSQC